jgi:hypothetical protein
MPWEEEEVRSSWDKLLCAMRYTDLYALAAAHSKKESLVAIFDNHN